MSQDSPQGHQPPAGPGFRLLERVTAAVLLLVVAALGWILLAAYQADGTEAVSEALVVAVLVLLTSALILVSVVALLHTR
jgi:hypothetical protein